MLYVFHRSGDHRDLHSFPTRRSSDLAILGGTGYARLEWLKPPPASISATFREFLRLLTTGTPRSACSRSAKARSEEHTSELQSRPHLVCRLLLEKKKQKEHGLVTEPR